MPRASLGDPPSPVPVGHCAGAFTVSRGRSPCPAPLRPGPDGYRHSVTWWPVPLSDPVGDSWEPAEPHSPLCCPDSHLVQIKVEEGFLSEGLGLHRCDPNTDLLVAPKPSVSWGGVPRAATHSRVDWEGLWPVDIQSCVGSKMHVLSHRDISGIRLSLTIDGLS